MLFRSSQTTQCKFYQKTHCVMEIKSSNYLLVLKLNKNLLHKICRQNLVRFQHLPEKFQRLLPLADAKYKYFCIPLASTLMIPRYMKIFLLALLRNTYLENIIASLLINFIFSFSIRSIYQYLISILMTDSFLVQAHIKCIFFSSCIKI